MDVVFRNLGRRRYADAWAEQLATRDAVERGDAPPTVLWVEHDPVITIGKHAGRASLLHDAGWYARHGIDIHTVERGGDATWHGPGQLVGYTVVPVGRAVRRLIGAILTSVGTIAEHHGLTPELRESPAGLWIGNDKLCAVGLAIRRGVSFHGFALNVAPDLSAFRAIVPCGLTGTGVTSLAVHSTTAVDVDDVRTRLEPILRVELTAVPDARRSVPCPA